MEEKQLYRQLMLETSDAIINRSFEVLKPLKKENKQVYDTVSELILKRKGTFLTRGYLARFSYEICGGKNWLSIIDFCVAVELELASMYYANRIFDKKGGDKIFKDQNNQILAALLAKDIATLSLSKLNKAISDRDIIKVRNIFDEIDKICCLGQFIDLNINKYKKGFKLSEKMMLNLYLKRCYMMNASFFEKIAQIGCFLANANNKQTISLCEFGKNYGMALQIVNDIVDFVPPNDNLGTSEKNPEDSYSDIKQGKLTAPIIYILYHGSNDEKKLIAKVLSNSKYDQSDLLKITKLLVTNGGIDYAKNLAKQYANKAKKTLRIFDKESRKPLSLMYVMLVSNRYFKALDNYN